MPLTQHYGYHRRKTGSGCTHIEYVTPKRLPSPSHAKDDRICNEDEAEIVLSVKSCDGDDEVSDLVYACVCIGLEPFEE